MSVTAFVMYFVLTFRQEQPMRGGVKKQSSGPQG